MLRRMRLVGVAIIVGLVAVPTMPAAPVPARAADSPLAAVPAQSPIVIHIKGVERVKDRAKTMIQSALGDMGGMAAGGIDAMFGRMLEGRKLTGVAPGGPVFFAFLELPNPEVEEPALAVIFRVTKYTEFRDNFLKDDERKELKTISDGIDRVDIDGNEAFMVDKGDYAVIATTKGVAESVAKAYPGMDGKLPKEVAAKMLDNDVSVFVNLATVNQTYGDQIRQGRDMFLAMMDQGGGMMDKNQIEMAKKMYGAMFQIILDGRAFVAAVDFRPEGLAVHMQANVGAETDTNQILKSQRPVALDSIGKLPAGQMTYSASDLGPEMTKLMATMMKGIMPSEGDGKNLLEAAYAQLGGAKGRAMFASADIPPAGVSFQEFGDPTAAMAGTLALFNGLGEGAMAMGGALKGKPIIKADAETHRGIKLTSVKLVWDFDKMATNIPGGGEGVTEMMKKMLGESMNLWVGVEGQRLIQISAKDWADAKSRLDVFLDGQKVVDKSPAFQAVKKQLPAQTSMLYFIDAGPISNVMADYMVTILKALPLPIAVPDSVKKISTDTAYIGFSVTLKPEHGSFEVFLPVKAVEEMKKVAMQFFMGG